jgi:hypothetical protein
MTAELLEALKSAYQDLHKADSKCVRLSWYRDAIAKAERSVEQRTMEIPK